jgi:predicted dehydrogenase
MKYPTSRREFLRTSAAAAAAAFIPARAFGANEKITIGCIGVGQRGTGNMRNFLGLDDCRVVAVCDPYAERRQKAKRLVDGQYGDTGCAMTGDYREIIARKDIDAVMIAAQDHWHALIATAAAAAGKDMYCEKPTGVSIAESQAMLRAVRKHKRVFQAGTWQRALGPFRQTCEMVRNGYVGKLHTVQVSAPGPQYQPKYDGPMDPQPVPEGFDWERWRGPAPAKPYNPGRVAWPDWYLIWDYCAGFICNWGVHHLDIAYWGCPALWQETFDVECRGVYRTKGFTDNIESWNATFTFASGLKMVFTDQKVNKTGTKFIGDKGWVHVDRGGMWAEPEALLQVRIKADELHLDPSLAPDEDWKPVKTKDGEKVAYASPNHGDDFLGCVRNRRDPLSDIQSTHVASCLGLIADIAARLEKKLTWDPKAETFIGCDEANRMLVREMHNGWKLDPA